MSIPTVGHVFESGIRANSMESNALDALVRHQLEAATKEMAMTFAEPASTRKSKTIIGDMGEYLAQTAQIWFSLTDRLIEGSHVAVAAEEEHEDAHVKHRVSDLNTLVAMDMDMSKLRKIRDLTEKFSQDVLEVWKRPNEPGQVVSAPTYQTASSFPGPERAAMMRPSGVVGNDVDPRVHSVQKMLSNSQVVDGHPSPPGNASGSDDSDDEDEQFAKIDMDALKQRGKGSYYCPLGHRCDKGGVDKEGKLVLFDRNSSFAQHCNKHRKPWRCDVPGCPNPPKKRKFARRDGLERHKATVKHRVVT
ncbi:hypothetical protein ACJ41O_009719 [Fusarium nematophilum]